MAGKGNARHGMYGTPTYKSWSEMKHRCGNPSRRDYVKVSYCKRWEKFENFFKDMGVRPEGTTLDRIDYSGDYKPSNCRWATPEEQANNTKRNVFYTYNGETKTMAQFAKQYGVSRSNLANKVYLFHMSFVEAMDYLLRKKVMTYR